MLSRYKSYVRGRRSNPVDFSSGDVVFVDIFSGVVCSVPLMSPSLSALFDMRYVHYIVSDSFLSKASGCMKYC